MVHDHLCPTAVCPVNGPMVWNWTLISPTSLVFLVADYHLGNSFRPSDPFLCPVFLDPERFSGVSGAYPGEEQAGDPGMSQRGSSGLKAAFSPCLHVASSVPASLLPLIWTPLLLILLINLSIDLSPLPGLLL